MYQNIDDEVYQGAVQDITRAICASDISDPALIHDLFVGLYPELSDADLTEIAEVMCDGYKRNPLAACAAVYMDEEDEGVASDILENYVSYASKLTVAEILSLGRLKVWYDGRVHPDHPVDFPAGYEPPTIDEFAEDLGVQIPLVLAGFIWDSIFSEV